MKNTRHLILILMFSLFLLFPSIATLIGISPNRYTVAPSEQKFPILKDNNIFKYLNDFDAYYSEKFNGKSMYYRSISGLKYNLFGTSAKRESVLVGKDGFLFLGNNASNIIDETLGVDLFSDNEIEQIQKRILRALNWMNKKDIKFYVLPGLNKHTIYPEKLPFEVDTSRLTKIDQVADIVNDIENATWIDVRENLMRAKKYGLLYRKTGTHWNKFGGYFAYRKIMNVLNKDFPGEFRPIPLKDMKRYSHDRTTFGLSRMLDYPIKEKTNEVKILDVRSKERPPKISKFKNRKNAELRFRAPKKKRKAVIVRDSYSDALIDFLKEHFEEVVFIRTPTLSRKIILKEKPDIVIYQVVERNLDIMVDYL